MNTQNPLPSPTNPAGAASGGTLSPDLRTTVATATGGVHQIDRRVVVTRSTNAHPQRPEASPHCLGPLASTTDASFCVGLMPAAPLTIGSTPMAAGAPAAVAPRIPLRGATPATPPPRTDRPGRRVR